MEVSVHIAPRALLSELRHVFPNRSLYLEGCLAVPTLQQSTQDLVNWGDEVELEKDRCLNVFSSFARTVCERLIAAGHWADYIDPCSGLPMIERESNSVFSEVECMQVLLHYRVLNAGMCKVLLHPTWGSSVYPATLFTQAPYSELATILEEFYQRETAEPPSS